MIIKWLGHSSFLIQSKSKLVTDPYDTSIAKLPADLSADIVTVSHNHFDHNFVQGVGGFPLIINTPGDYDKAGFHIHGIAAYHDNENGAIRGTDTIFTIESEGVRLCHLGDLGQSLSDEQINDIGEIDILMIPVGGFYTIEPDEAVRVTRQISPKIVIPMHYKVDGFTPANLEITSDDDFIRQLGWGIEQLSYLEITKENIVNQKLIKLHITR